MPDYRHSLMPKVCIWSTVFSLFHRSLTLSHIFFSSSGEHDSHLNVYWNAERKCRKFTKFWSTFYIVYDLSAYAIGFFYSIYFILIGQYDTSTWPTSIELPLPFGTATIWGWYLHFITFTILDLMYMVFMISATTYFVCSCLYINAMCDHIDLIRQSIQFDLNDFGQSKLNPSQWKAFNEKSMGKIQKIIAVQVEINE